MHNRQLFFAAVIVSTIIAAAFLCSWLSAILLPLFLAFIIAYILDPAVRYVELRGLTRPLAIALVLVLIILIAITFGYFFTEALRRELLTMQGQLPDYAGRLYALIPHQAKVYFDIETPEKVYSRINGAIVTLRALPIGVYRDTLLVVQRAFATTLSLIITVLGYFIIPVYLYYFLKDLPKMRPGMLELLPFRWREGINVLLGEIHATLSAFIRGQLLVCLILAVFYSIGLWFIGIDLALLIGSLAGLAFIIPYLGTLIGIVLSMLMALLKFQDILHPLLCLGWFALVQALEGGVITPKIVGETVGLHPLVIMLALLVGGQVGGIFGMLLAVPMTAVLNVFGRALLSRYRESRFFREGEWQ